MITLKQTNVKHTENTIFVDLSRLKTVN